jgi:hypothetical protein
MVSTVLWRRYAAWEVDKAMMFVSVRLPVEDRGGRRRLREGEGSGE